MGMEVDCTQLVVDLVRTCLYYCPFGAFMIVIYLISSKELSNMNDYKKKFVLTINHGILC